MSGSAQMLCSTQINNVAINGISIDCVPTKKCINHDSRFWCATLNQSVQVGITGTASTK